jgi:hypothetical protein
LNIQKKKHCIEDKKNREKLFLKKKILKKNLQSNETAKIQEKVAKGHRISLLPSKT